MISDEEDEKLHREFAEKIITKEYSSVVISLMDANGTCKNYFGGPKITCLGMAETAKQDLLRIINTPAD